MTGRRDMNGWRTPILEHFSKASAAAGRLTVVGDPDELLTEPGVVERLAERGFELITFGDPVAFRYAYESRFRQHWDRGESTHLVVVIRTDRMDLQSIPHDLLEEARANGRVISFSLVELFPPLAPNVVAELDPVHFDALARAVSKAEPGNLGANATRDFILRHVFQIAPELIKKPADLFRVLLRRHYRSQVFPESLDDRLIELLTQNKTWRKWPLERIVPGRDSFLTFLAERWPHFLISKGYASVPGRASTPPSINGPIEVPFDHDDVKVYIDTLFAEGILEPTSSVEASSVEGTWYRVGVTGRPAEDAAIRLARLLDDIDARLPGDGGSHASWSELALSWAEAIRLRWTLPGPVDPLVAKRIDALHDQIEDRFTAWLLQGYGSIHSLSHYPRPRTLDKISRFLAHRRGANTAGKVALIVVDGLALDQWLLLREGLTGLHLDESTAFAWVPTLTAVSRQAIFAGEPPYFYPDHLFTTRKEARHWARFWGDHQLTGASVGYVCQKKAEIDEVFALRVKEASEHPQCRALAVVVGKVDQMIHGTVTGTGGMHAGVRHWTDQGHFRALVDDLLNLEFDVFLTADHGNIEGIGTGAPNEGSVAQERHERVRVYSDELTRRNAHLAVADSISWPPVGLPAKYLALFPARRGAFIHVGQHRVSHGGLSIEEVIVPFVRISEAT